MNIKASDFTTYYEKSGFTETPRYEETIKYIKLLAEKAPKKDIISVKSFGTSVMGRDLPYIIIDKNRNFTAESIRKSGNIILYVQACIHPGESEGKDAGLLLLRDILINNKYSELLDNVSLVFIPFFNPDGHERFSAYNRMNQNGPKEMGWRTTSQNYNLNRDFVKADSPEMQAWLKLYNEFMPEFLIDCHTTDGADYQYTVTYGIEIFGNTERNLSDWLENKYIVDLKKQIFEDGYKSFPYVMFRNWHDPKSGLVSWVTPPMLSTGYVALKNRASLLLETHSLKDYKTRVEASYSVILNTMRVLYNEKDKLQTLIAKADSLANNIAGVNYPLEYEQTKDSVLVDFEGNRYYSKKSNSLGGEVYVYTKEPDTFTVPWFKDFVPTSFTKIPEYYIIPAQWTEVIKRLDWHNISYRRTKENVELSVNTYKFDSVSWSKSPTEGKQKVTSFKLFEISNKVLYPAGSVIVPVNQTNSRLLIHLLEPKAYDSFVKWGFFNTIFEQKEYAESYIIDAVADGMLNDPRIKAEYDKLLAENPKAKENQRFMVNWFYERSLWKDTFLNIYPVGKIFEGGLIKGL